MREKKRTEAATNVFGLISNCERSFLLFVFCYIPGEGAFKGDVLPFVDELYQNINQGPALVREFLFCLQGFICINKAC
jgi:hypothetical protein